MHLGAPRECPNPMRARQQHALEPAVPEQQPAVELGYADVGEHWNLTQKTKERDPKCAHSGGVRETPGAARLWPGDTCTQADGSLSARAHALGPCSRSADGTARSLPPDAAEAALDAPRTPPQVAG